VELVSLVLGEGDVELAVGLGDVDVGEPVGLGDVELAVGLGDDDDCGCTKISIVLPWGRVCPALGLWFQTVFGGTGWPAGAASTKILTWKPWPCSICWASVAVSPITGCTLAPPPET
jgi:hypothetical protein